MGPQAAHPLGSVFWTCCCQSPRSQCSSQVHRPAVSDHSALTWATYHAVRYIVVQPTLNHPRACRTRSRALPRIPLLGTLQHDFTVLKLP